MTQSSLFPRQLIVLAVVLPLAIMMGYMLATPDSTNTVLFLVLVGLVLATPILLRWHHPLLVITWNASIHILLLPGQPALWMLIAGVSLAISLLNKIMDRESVWLNVPSVTWPLLFLAFLVIVTTKLTGGFGLRVLGSGTYGGRKTVFVLASVIGYFALSCRPIPLHLAQRYFGMFTLAGLSGALSNLIYFAGPSFYFLYYFIPTDYAMSQAVEDVYGAVLQMKFTRLTGVTVAATAIFYFLMGRHGIRGIFSRPWRTLLLLAVFAVSTLGGFRSALLVCGLTLFVQALYERIYRTRLMLVFIIGGIIFGALLIPLSSHLPLSVQRSLSFLPLDIDPVAKADAQSSVEWRITMWKVLVTQIPKYFWIGKGYAINPTDLYMAEQSARMGFSSAATDAAILSGDFHSGPLSIQIPFGIFGTLGLIWFLVAGLRVLYRNYRYGHASLKIINTFVLSYFIARMVFYWFFFGSFESDITLFAGLIGLSISLNGGMTAPPPSRT